jgi:hypothetical protein
MNKIALSLALALAMSNTARAGDARFQAFTAGLIGAVLLNTYLADDERKAEAPPPPPPPKKTPRQIYLETCPAYGFSEQYCIGIWEGKKPTESVGSLVDKTAR